MQIAVTAGAGTMDDGSARSMGGPRHAGVHDGGPDRSNAAAQQVHRRAAEATTQRSCLQPVTGAQPASAAPRVPRLGKAAAAQFQHLPFLVSGGYQLSENQRETWEKPPNEGERDRASNQS